MKFKINNLKNFSLSLHQKSFSSLFSPNRAWQLLFLTSNRTRQLFNLQSCGNFRVFQLQQFLMYQQKSFYRWNFPFLLKDVEAVFRSNSHKNVQKKVFQPIRIKAFTGEKTAIGELQAIGSSSRSSSSYCTFSSYCGFLITVVWRGRRFCHGEVRWENCWCWKRWWKCWVNNAKRR